MISIYIPGFDIVFLGKARSCDEQQSSDRNMTQHLVRSIWFEYAHYEMILHLVRALEAMF